MAIFARENMKGVDADHTSSPSGVTSSPSSEHQIDYSELLSVQLCLQPLSVS